MAVTRPLKEGSVTTYQQKVAAGFPDILASEVDADLDTIYAAWNGGVATANLIDGSVTSAKLATGAVRGTPSSGGTQREILKASIWAGDDLIDLSIPKTKLAVGAAVQNSVVGTFPTSFASATVGAFVTILTLPVLTTRGGRVLLMGAPGGYFIGTPAGATFYVQLLRNGTQIAAWHYDVQSITGGNTKVPMPPVSWTDAPAAGATTYAYLIQQTVSASFSTAADNPGQLTAVELS